MAVEARIRVHHRGCISERTRGSTTITQTSGDGPGALFLATGETPDELDAIMDYLEEELVDYRLVSREPKVAMVRGGCPPSGVEDCIRSYGCSIVWPALFSEGREFFTILAPSRDRLRQLIERLEEFGGAELLAVSEVDAEDLSLTVNLGGVAGSLTARQLAVLTKAVEAGYYDAPRRVSTEQLADAFGIGRTTLEEHLRKAEAKVLQSTVGMLRNHPSVADAVPGRDAGPAPGLEA